LIRFLEDLGTPLPPALKTAADFILHIDIVNQFESDETDIPRLAALLEEARHRKVNVWDDDLQYAISKKMERVLAKIQESPGDSARAEHASRLAEIVHSLPIEPHLWRVRNKYWKMLRTVLPEYRDKAAKGDEAATEWVKHFLALGDHLSFARQHLQTDSIQEA